MTGPNGPSELGEPKADSRPTTECIHGVATVPESWMGLKVVDNVHDVE